jgi:hypothetical protein
MRAHPRAALHEEEGQVAPALLLAVLLTFAAALALFAVGRVGDQSARTDSAADAAALAVGREFSERAADTILAGGGLNLGNLGAFSTAGLDARAAEYARGNGSDLTALRFLGYSGLGDWRFEVETRASDEVVDEMLSRRSFRSEARSAVSVRFTGLCGGAGGVGLDMYGGCLTPDLLAQLCAPPPPPPPPPDDDEETPPDEEEEEEEPPPPPPDPLPPWLEGESCPSVGDLRDALGPDVRLVS